MGVEVKDKRGGGGEDNKWVVEVRDNTGGGGEG